MQNSKIFNQTGHSSHPHGAGFLANSSMKRIVIPNTTKTTYGGALDALIESVMGREIKAMRFSMFDTDEESGGYSSSGLWHILVPDLRSTEPVFEGLVVLSTDYWRITDGEIFSPEMTSPKWGEVLRAVDDILTESDGDGVFLEGFCDTGRETATGARIIRISIGS